MAIVRFLDKNQNCYQVSPPSANMMIYLNPEEKRKLLETKDGEVLYLVDAKLIDPQVKIIKDALNIPNPKQMI